MKKLAAHDKTFATITIPSDKTAKHQLQLLDAPHFHAVHAIFTK